MDGRVVVKCELKCTYSIVWIKQLRGTGGRSMLVVDIEVMIKFNKSPIPDSTACYRHRCHEGVEYRRETREVSRRIEVCYISASSDIITFHLALRLLIQEPWREILMDISVLKARNLASIESFTRMVRRLLRWKMLMDVGRVVHSVRWNFEVEPESETQKR
jgi:hypothetical protein